MLFFVQVIVVPHVGIEPMSKDQNSRGTKKSAPRGESPASMRSQLDRLDRDLLKLISQRGKLASQLTRILLTPEDGAANHVPAVITRDEESIADLLSQNKGPLSNDCIRAVFREINSGSRAITKHVRVGYLGPAYSYSHLAALHRFGSSVDQVPVGSISAVFEEVNRGHVDFGLVPIENSTDGRIADTLDMFTRLRVRICGEVQLRIHHHLLGKCPRADIREVFSRPQALSQCRNWLTKHLPGVRLIEVISTSDAARLAQDRQGTAAIASVEAGVFYGLDVLAEKIEDNSANVTRFAVIGEGSTQRTGHDKMAAMFEIEHRPGSLADSMAIFKRNRLNLTWIESFPIARPEGGYLFFIEVDGHEADSRVRKALAALEKRAVRLEILGSYPRSEPIG